MKLEHIGMIGYGEVGKIFSAALKSHVGMVSAWDVKFAPRVPGNADLLHAAEAGIAACDSVPSLCKGADLIISAVTASNALEVARVVAPHVREGTFFLDLNSASPTTKQHAARLIDGAGGRYVEAGVMTSVAPHGIAVPMLLGGEHAEELAQVLASFGMSAKPVAREIGTASAIKLCRSVMIKGLEALVVESYTTARKFGVEAFMLPSLQETFPGIDWDKQGAYFFSRVVRHGKRRAEEMREAANMVREAGFESWMAAATARKQDWIALQTRNGVFAEMPLDAGWRDYADRLIEHEEK
ncbi:MAG: DUF1932 domain-containing protein [Pseudomonadota bacterium]